MSEEKTSVNPNLSRRVFLQGSTLAGFSAFLVACGTSGTGTQSAAPSTSSAAAAPPAAASRRSTT
jgi:hypothetical protein